MNSWNREDFLEYRRLKRSGYTDSMLIEHFGDIIYSSGLYNRKSTIMPWLEFITEIKIVPEHTEYDYSKIPSDYYLGKYDYLISFYNDDVKYIISLFYYIVNNIKTYSILLTTNDQWMEYKDKTKEYVKKGYITTSERDELVKIVEKETNYNQLYPVIKKVSFILFDIIQNKINDTNTILSIGDTLNPIKINLYRNIITNSFNNVEEIGEIFDTSENRYFLYKIK